MELLKLFDSKNISDFFEIKTLLQEEPYNLIVKEDNDFPNLYMITYDRNISNLESSVVKQCRGIILEKNTNKIVCYTFNKGVDSVGELDWDSVKVELSIDGTQIRLFYYDGKWNFATTRCIDAKKSRWFSNLSFYQMYEDCLNGMDGEYDYDALDKKCCYSFVICHPQNRIVVQYDKPHLVHVLTRNLETLEEVKEDLGEIENPKVFTHFKSYQEIIDDCNSNENLEEGYMLCDKHGNRLKVKNSSYNRVKELRGNTNNLFYRYLELRYDNMVDTYLSFYPEFKSKFALYELDIRKLASEIQKVYMNKHVHKVAIMIPNHLKTMIYKLHGQFIDTQVKTDVNKVIEELNKLHPSQICFMYNRTFRPHHPYHGN